MSAPILRNQHHPHLWVNQEMTAQFCDNCSQVDFLPKDDEDFAMRAKNFVKKHKDCEPDTD